MDIGHLPDEILENIFTHLHQKDIENARLVCNRWRRISYLQSVQKQTNTVMPNYRELVGTFIPSTAFTKQFKPSNIYITVLQADIVTHSDRKMSHEFWQQIGRGVKELTLRIQGSRITRLPGILECCPNLQKLTVITCNALRRRVFTLPFSSVCFSKLLTLTLEGEHQLIFPLLSEAIEKAPCLKDIKFNCGVGLCPMIRFHRPLHVDLDFENALHLKRINIDCSTVGDTFIDILTGYLCNRLESINIVVYEEDGSDALEYMMDRCKNLKELMIGKWNNRYFNFGEFFLTMTNLTVVSFFCTDCINDNAVVYLGCLPNLTHLSLSHCLNVTDFGICKLFNHKVKRTIIELRLMTLNITDIVMKEIAPFVPNLKVLNLSNCTLITIASVQYIANNILSLQCLSLGGCYKVDSTVRKAFKGQLPPCMNTMSQLEHLDISSNTNFSEACALGLKLSHLKVLEAHPINVQNLRRQCPSLRFVNNLCCQTCRILTNGLIVRLKKQKILECFTSPLGPCYKALCLDRH